MQLSNAPSKIKLPFANAGTKNTIPVASQIGITAGAASYTDGFPPLTFTPVASGGVPPFGADFNGVFNAATAIERWYSAGAGFVYDSAFATDSNVGGYPKGARVLRSDGLGYWLNIADNNTTNPESGGTNWVPDYTYGVAAVTMTGSNVTLTALQYGQPIINITGTLTANVQLLFPDGIAGKWVVFNNTTGSFTITAKTVTGTGVSLSAGANAIASNATDIYTTSSVTIASTAQAQALTNNTTVISPLRLAEAFQGTNQSLTTNGWQKIPGGLILQWLTVTATATSVGFVATATLPITFPNAGLAAFGNWKLNTTVSGNGAVSAQFVSASQLTVVLDYANSTEPTGSQSVFVFVIGY